jgi:predicted type IV restriction endonuclease
MAVDIRRSLKKFVPHLLAAREQNLNEADTVQRLVKFLEDVLGYDAMSEITREKQVKDRYVDLAIKIDGTVRFLIEAKSAGTILRDRHIEQAEHYAAQDNIRWVLLTNGVVWNLYHLTFEEGIESTRVFSVDLSSGDVTDDHSNCLSLLHRQSVRKDALEEHWRHKVALHPASLGKSLFNEDVLRMIRRDIRKREGLQVDEEDLVIALHELFSSETREQMGPPRVRRRRKAKKAEPAITAAELLAGLPDDAEPT